MPISINPEDKKLLRIVFDYAKDKRTRLYIVGGYLRDLTIKRRKSNPDIDFCIRSHAISFARGLSQRLKAGFVVLDKEHGACRLIKKQKDKIYTLDFTDFRSRDLKEDLLLRDFTINTIAVELQEAQENSIREEALIDLYGGRKDLKAGLIRVVNKAAFDDDPLRIMRAFSLSAVLGFAIESETLKLIKAKKEQLSTVSFERIRDELFKILSQDGSVSHLAVMDKLRVLKVILPEIEVMRGVNQGPYHHLDVLNHSFETVRQFEKLVGENRRNREIADYLQEKISSERRRSDLMKLGALLHDIGKPQAKRRREGKTMFHGHERVGAAMAIGISRRFKLSNNEIESLKKMIFWHLRPGYLADNERITPRAMFRYFRDTGDEGVSTLLLSMADQRSTRGPLTSEGSRLHHEKVVYALIKEYFRKKKEKKLPRLLNGNNLINKFKLEPSPLIGKILSRLEELQAVGSVRTRAEALKEAERFLKKKSPRSLK